MIDFCHITPTAFIDDIFSEDEQRIHLVLAHLIEEDSEYRNKYLRLAEADHEIIMDNSAFEMYKRELPMYPTEKLIQMAVACQASYVVMSDYPGEDWLKTVHAAEKMIPQLKDAELGTFYCPQSLPGDVDGLVDSFKWGLSNPDVDYIAFSILNIPLAYGCESNNPIQKYLSRLHFMNRLEDEGLLPGLLGKKVHFLGMTEGPNEISLMRGFTDFIDTWDSSAAVWAGLNGIKFDNSPTGLSKGKFEKEVDFDYKVGDNISLAKQSIQYIEELCYAA